ncbi:MAG TPA: cyclopropane-fatty-acyl-phospholipid synthase family protein [Caulobacteraceae bacterium]|nr:cyclopropane-fatty-acyl-phospholipid synthase family protein [Caulobacteraceae bacterium]
MSLTGLAARAAERAPIPDALARLGVGYLVNRTRRRLEAEAAPETAFARAMERAPIALATDAANRQHYELPPEFFGLILGPHRKYSSCLYAPGDTLAEAEARALAETCLHAGLADGQTVLELGCGWGSLSLWMAERYPASRIVAVSNSASQRRFIEGEAAARGLSNLRVITADMNDFAIGERFDRIVSVEMFEHMSNWRALLGRARQWLSPDGRLFLHVFTHRDHPYRFDVGDQDDWIAQHFFTGGIMPSHRLIHSFGDLFAVEAEWRWSGDHYRRTALDWLANYDRNAEAVAAILRDVYGADWRMWRRRWRLFFLATAGLFGAGRGEVWGVSHYRLAHAR